MNKKTILFFVDKKNIKKKPLKHHKTDSSLKITNQNGKKFPLQKKKQKSHICENKIKMHLIIYEGC